MAISRRTLDFLSRWVYTPLALGIIAFFVYVTLTGKYLDGLGRPILAIAGGLGFLVLFWMYYVRWFVADSQFVYPTWPPFLSACPDYLTFMGRDPASGRSMCVDFVGVSRRNGLKKADILLPPKAQDRDYIFLTNPSDSTEKKCNDAIGRGLSWSGITAGTGCA